MPLNANPDTLFQYDNYKYSHRHFIDAEYLRKPFRDTLKEVIEYYRHNVIYLDSTNILASILFNTQVRLDLNDYQYRQFIDSRSRGLTRSFNLTSSFTYGRIFSNEFYSNKEILILDDSIFDVDYVVNNWENIIPVYPLLHSWSNISFTLPIGGVLDTGNDGLSVIAINIPMLAFQFRCFLKNKLLHNDPLNSTIPIFLSQYVLPNMLAQQTDLAIFNILKNTYYKKENSKSLVNMPFPLPVHNYMNKVINLSEKVLNNITKETLLYPQMLETIPAIFYRNMEYVLRMPNIANTRQVWWALELTRLSTLIFLIKAGGINSVRYNKYYLTEQQKDLSYLLSERIYNKMFDLDYANEVKNKIEFIINL